MFHAIRIPIGFCLVLATGMSARGQAGSPLHSALPDIRDAYGISIADFDGDDDLDIYLVGFRSLNRMLLNQGNGLFSDASIPSGTGGNLMPLGTRNLELGCSAADFDNDDDIDLMIAGWGDGLALLRNRGDGSFEEVTLKMGIRRDLRSNMAAFSDMDADGWLDLLLTHETGPMALYRNIRGLRFEGLPLAESGLPSDSGSQAALFTDLNLDGKPDLVVAGWHRPAQVFQSLGGFRFQSVSTGLTWPPGSRCNAALHGDIDRDGDIDLIFTSRGGPPLVSLNRLDPELRAKHPADWNAPNRDVTLAPCDSNCGLQDTLDAYGGGLLDLDDDGDVDLFITGRQPERLYRNVGGTFTPVSLDEWNWPVSGSRYSTGFMSAELGPNLERQGVAANRDTGCIFIPLPKPSQRQARIRLHGVTSNPQGLGSSLTLWRKAERDSGDKPWQWLSTQDLPGAQGYLSSYIGDVLFSLPDTVSEYRVRVVFPSGRVVTRSLPSPNRELDVWENGFLGGFAVKSLRLTQIWLGDREHFKRVLYFVAGFLVLGWAIRWFIGASARSIARRDYTKTLEAKNLEMERLLHQLHQTQGQLIQHEKLASLGQLVAGIAHELNNPIGFIYANLHQIARYLNAMPLDSLDDRSRRNLEKVDEALRESQDGALRVRDIVQNLRGLSRGSAVKFDAPPTKQPCDLKDIIQKALAISRTGFAPGIQIDNTIGALPLIAADAGQLQQVFVNLFVNAGQAMGEQGVLTLRSRVSDVEIHIDVQDNGPGIPPNHVPKLFDPFFTTKPVGQGLGLGLHLAYTIVKAHGGTLTVASQTGHGACFTMHLPLEAPPGSLRTEADTHPKKT
jgi:signal transduction histidine kinase